MEGRDACGVLGKIPQIQFFLLSLGNPSGFPWGFLGHGAILEFCLECCCFQGFRELTLTRHCSWEGFGNVLCSSQTVSELIQAFQTWPLGFPMDLLDLCLCPVLETGKEGMWRLCIKLPEKQGGNNLP